MAGVLEVSGFDGVEHFRDQGWVALLALAEEEEEAFEGDGEGGE